MNKDTNAWVLKSSAIEAANSLRVKDWINAQPNEKTFPCYVYPDGKYLGLSPPKGLTKPDHALIEFYIPDRCTLEVPIQTVEVKHRYLKHGVRADFVPMINIIEANSSSIISHKLP